MAERFHEDHSGKLSPAERDRLEVVAKSIEERHGPLAVEGIDNTGKDIAHLTYDERVLQHIEQAESTIRIAKYAPRLFGRRYAARREVEDSAEQPLSSWPNKRIIQVGGVALVIGGFLGSAAASLTVVLFGASLNVAVPFIAGAFLLGALIGGNEARKETRPPRS